ncbi:MAG: hypothetical protein KDI47_05055 [Gammaproteobacteria bacterium]|nr:hypothetical protein [Gammaproteobacteria bacterium]
MEKTSVLALQLGGSPAEVIMTFPKLLLIVFAAFLPDLSGTVGDAAIHGLKLVAVAGLLGAVHYDPIFVSVVRGARCRNRHHRADAADHLLLIAADSRRLVCLRQCCGAAHLS